MSSNAPARSGTRSLLFLGGLGAIGLIVLCGSPVGLFFLVRQWMTAPGGPARSLSAKAGLTPYGWITPPGQLKHLPGYGVYFQKSRVTDADLRVLNELTPPNHVSLIDLSHTQISDVGLANLRGLTNLQWCLFNDMKITDAGLGELKDMTRMRAIYLDNNAIGDAGIEYLRDMSELEWLKLTGTQITDDGLQYLKGMHRLKHLYVDRTSVTLPALRQLKLDLPDLKDLIYSPEWTVGKKRLIDLGAQVLVNNNFQAWSIDLTQSPTGRAFNDDDLAEISDLPDITRLVLDRTDITTKSAEALKNFPRLYHLSLRSTPVDDRALEAIHGFEKMEVLYLDGTAVTDAGLVHLTTLPKLWYLSLTDTAITDAGLTHIGKIAKLEHLVLNGTKVTDAGMTNLLGIERLIHLETANTQISDAGFKELNGRFPHLKRGQ